MSVPYSIDGISGTGTQSDPYLVSDLDSVLQCIAVSDAYVELVDDIYCGDDPTYRSIVSVSFNIQCKKFYAQTKKNIYGLQTYGNSSTSGTFMTAVANSSIENIGFIDTVLYRGISGSDIYDFQLDDTTAITNCTFAIFCVPKNNNKSCGLFVGGVFTRCAIKYQFPLNPKWYNNNTSGLSVSTVGNSFKVASASYCYISILNLVINWKNDYTFFKRVDHSSIYMDNLRFEVDSGSWYAGSVYCTDSSDGWNLVYCNVGHYNHMFYSYSIQNLYFGGASKTLFYADKTDDGYSDVDELKIVTTGQAQATTMSNMKDPNYLTDQGFITSTVTVLQNGWDSNEYYYRDDFFMPVPTGVDGTNVGVSTVYKDFAYKSGRTCEVYAPVNNMQPLGSFAKSNIQSIVIRKEITELGRYAFIDSGIQSATLAPDCKYYSATFPSTATISFYTAVVNIPNSHYDLNLTDTSIPDASSISISVTDPSGTITRPLSGYEYRNLYTDMPVNNATAGVYYQCGLSDQYIHSDFTYTISATNLFTSSFSNGYIDSSGQVQSDSDTLVSGYTILDQGTYLSSLLPRTSNIKVHLYSYPIVTLDSSNATKPSSISVSTSQTTVSGTPPVSVPTTDVQISDYTVYGNSVLSSDSPTPSSPASISGMCWGYQNIFPNSAYSVQNSGGVTFISDGFGGYHIKGKASSYVEFPVDLVSSVTFPYSINNGGTGCLYFGNTTSIGNIVVRFLNGSTSQDYWSSTYITNIPHITQGYGSLQGKTVNRLRFEITSGSTYYDIHFYIMLTSDGVGISGGRTFAVYGSSQTTSITNNNTPVYIPTSSCEMLAIPSSDVYDSLNYSNSQITKRCIKYVFTGSEVITWNVSTNKFSCNVSDIGIKQNSGLLCTHLQYTDSPSGDPSTDLGKCYCDSSLNLCFDSTSMSTSVDFNTYLSSQYSNNTPVTIIAELPSASTLSQSLPKLYPKDVEYIGSTDDSFKKTPITFTTSDKYNVKYEIKNESGTAISASDISNFGCYSI